LRASRRKQGITEIGVRLGSLRIELKGAPVGSGSFLEARKIAQGAAQVGMDILQLCIERSGTVICGQSLIETP